MTPGLAMFLFAVVTLVVAAVTFAVAEHLATNQDPTRCAPDCPACPENHPPISEWDGTPNGGTYTAGPGELIINGRVRDETGMWVPVDDFEHDSVQLAADNSVQTDPQ